MERCFVMLKPGVINRRIVGEVLSRLEKKGLNLVAMKMMTIIMQNTKKNPFLKN